jgi:rhodanese-related sulfurtransferase
VAEPVRVGPEEVRPKVDAGEALLVCAYDEDWKFQQMHLSGAISHSELRSRLPSLPKDQEIVFYCA